ncbi:MAG: hypothetical protein CSA33_03580 [Desulfobulbus propionicus]|nr:MAG: hypothetical protein CSA33_03580 [Desulfobulbus propionicus]
MTDFQHHWNLETAMEILKHPTVDSTTWSEAVEWLLVHGPPTVKELLMSASEYATRESFPELKPGGYDTEGSPCYTISELAQALGITEEEAEKIIAEKEERHGVSHRRGSGETTPLQ